MGGRRREKVAGGERRRERAGEGGRGREEVAKGGRGWMRSALCVAVRPVPDARLDVGGRALAQRVPIGLAARLRRTRGAIASAVHAGGAECTCACVWLGD